MDCEKALALISARLDREILPSENAWLSDYLRQCASCQATAEAFAVQPEGLSDRPSCADGGATPDRVSSSIATFCSAKPSRRRLAISYGMLVGVACLTAAVLVVTFLRSRNKPSYLSPGGATPVIPMPPAPMAQSERLMPRSLPKVPDPAPLQPGQTVTTAAGERRRVTLPDGSAVYLNENTTLTFSQDHVLALQTGTAYFEANPSDNGPDSGLAVATDDGYRIALSSKFAVQKEPEGTRLLAVTDDLTVTHADRGAPAGPVPVIHAGEMLAPHAHVATPGPRLSHVLDWTRDLMAASEPALVPASSYDGGALIAVDAGDQEAKLELRKYHVDVHIEDGFARTTIDQTYFNKHPWRLEGTFYFPLPPDASLSRLAMYVDGQLNEGGMVERDYGRTVFDRIVAGQRDPALLEWVNGSTFKMRVFPLEGRQEKRLILSYTQRVPTLYGRSLYRFPAGHSLQNVRDWSFHALVKNGATDIAASPTHLSMKRTVQGGDLMLDDAAENCKLDRDIVLDLTDPAFVAEKKELARFARADLDGNTYVMMRYRPQLPETKKRKPRDWIFLYETSADRDPLLARTQIEIIRGMLQYAERDDTFRILAVSNRVRLFPDPTLAMGAAPQLPGGASASSMAVTPENVAAALTFLEQTPLVGGLDLGVAFQTAQKSLAPHGNSYIVHVGGGRSGMGMPQNEIPMLLSRRTPYIGIGVGKQWNRAFMKECADKTAGYFTQINPDESSRWRAFDLMAMLNTPRLLSIKVVDQDRDPDADKGPLFLLDSYAVAQGEELCAVAQVRTMPDALTITGTLDGKPFARTVRVENIADEAAYVPRTWAKMEIDRLLADDARFYKEAIIKLSKSMYVMTPFTSLLVLENEWMYKQYNVDRGRKDHWAMYQCPEKIPIVYEPDPTMPADVRNAPKGTKPAPFEVLQSVVIRVPSQWPVLGSRQGQRGPRVLDGNSLLADKSLPSPMPGRPWIEPVPRAFAPPGNFVNPVVGPRVTAGGAGGGFGGFPAFDSLDIQEQVEDFLQPPPARFTTGDVLKDIASRLEARDRPQALPNSPSKNTGNWSVERQHYIDNPSLFSDLLAYAPGLNTGKADLLATLDAEALPDLRLAPGRIDPAARRLIDAARSGGWRKLTLTNEKNQSHGEVLFDGAGRYRYEGEVSLGLREIVVCDGSSLLHLYPEIGLAGRRTVSSFHRAEFVGLLPWLLPPADDLARGADVDYVDANTVAVVPRSKDPATQARLHLLFKDGRLVERRLIEMPSKRPALHELYDADGGVRILDRDGKEVQHSTYHMQSAEAPDLRPDLSKLVVLSLPFRWAEHTAAKLNVTLWPQGDKAPEERLAALSTDDALVLLTALAVECRNWQAPNVYTICFAQRGDQRRGLFTLLAAGGVPLSQVPSFRRCLEQQPDDELLQYLALCDDPYCQALQRHVPLFAKGAARMRTPLFQELAEAQAHLRFWDRPRPPSFFRLGVQHDLPAAEAVIDRHVGDGLGRALLLQMQDATDLAKAGTKPLHTALAKEWGRMAAANDGGYQARFEHACCLYEASQRAEAVAQLKKVYQEALDAGIVALLDSRFKAVAQKIVGTTSGDEWTAPIRQTATTFLERRQYATVLSLAHQCRRVEEPALAETLLDSLIRKTESAPDAWVWRLAVVDYQAQVGDYAQAEAVLQPLLEDPRMAEAPLLWRLASTVAEWRGKEDRAVVYLEKALDLEYRHLPDVIVLQHWRADYGRLLSYYYTLASTAKRLNVAPPKDLLPRTLRAVDRWRTYDPEQGQPCLMAATIFVQLGEKDLGWDYYTTTIASLGNDMIHWRGAAGELSQAGEFDLADRALAVASDVDPHNAGVVWQRAQNMRLANRQAEANKLLRRLAEEKWPPEFADICIFARQTLQGR